MLKKLLIPIAISSAFLFVFFHYVPVEKLKEALSNVKPENFLLAFFLYSLSQLIRSLRWFPMMRELGFWNIYLINSANIFLNNVLPARTGELSWFYYAKKLGVPLKLSVWTFFVGRLFDLVALLFWGAIFYGFAKGSLVSFFFALILSLISVLSYKAYFLIPSWKKLRDLKEYLRENSSFKLFTFLFACSLLSVLLKFLSLWKLLEIPSFSQFFLSFSFGELSTILPVHSFMGYGTYELSFALPSKLTGEPTKDLLLNAFLAHNFLLISSAIYGIPSLFILHGKRINN